MLSHCRTVRRSIRLLTMAGVMSTAGLVSCGRLKPGQSVSAEQAVVIFTNESLAQADVFAVAPSVSARRIGTVMSGRTETLTVPAEIATRGTLQLVARLLASPRAPGSGTIAIRPGDRLAVRLPLDERTLVVLPAGS